MAGTLLNFVPGFGLGYLVVRRKKAFWITLGLSIVVGYLAFEVSVSIIIAELRSDCVWTFGTLTEICDYAIYDNIPLVYQIYGGLVAIAVINIITAVHLLGELRIGVNDAQRDA